MVSHTRRTVLAAVGLATVPLAGCTDEAGDEQAFDGWLSDADNYDGVVDETGADTVTVTVGADNGGQPYGYSPAAVRVDPDTTVQWEWNGRGGAHNVKEDGGDYESELVNESGHTFTHTFTESGTSKYLCSPHQQFGMKGVVVVE